MAKLINGNGNPAIYAAEDADLIASLAGNVTCIANVGNKYAATEEDATTIRLDDGVIITKEGRRIQLEAGESDTFYIPTGTSGQSNYYIIGYKLVQNPDSTQVAEQFVQKMNSSSETITEDTFRSGATEVYVSVYRVTQVGFTIDSISGLLPELLDNASIKEDIDQINSDLIGTQKTYTITSIVGTHDIHIKQYGGLLTLYGFAGIHGALAGQPDTILTIDNYDGIPRQGIAFFGNSDGIASASPTRSCAIDSAGNLKVVVLPTDTGDFLFFRVVY